MAKNFEPTGKVRILIRTEIRILPVSTSADPHIRILPPADHFVVDAELAGTGDRSKCDIEV